MNPFRILGLQNAVKFWLTINGIIVYNTNASVTDGSGVGIYHWVTSKWVKMLNSDFVEADGVVGNEITDTILNGGLTRSGAGTAESPYKVGIKAGGIRDGMIAVGGINVNKIMTTQADSGLYAISNGSSVTFSPIRASLRTDTFKAVARDLDTVTWTKILDTTYVTDVKAHEIIGIIVQDLKSGDFCRKTSDHPLADVAAVANWIWVRPWHNAAGANMSFVCYRPSI
ncbi:hypothetical protein FACS189446_8020 [Bacteroidia bacterium]|nr:hypothetical protein FACS189446_8020 [Bacteroidia bacterium]